MLADRRETITLPVIMVSFLIEVYLFFSRALIICEKTYRVLFKQAFDFLYQRVSGSLNLMVRFSYKMRLP